MPAQRFVILCGVLTVMIGLACGRDPARAVLEVDNPVRSIPAPPLGNGIVLRALAEPPSPQRVRLGRWLFFDKRLSADGSIACATCHQPEHGFSQPTPLATGIGGQRSRRKVPPILNLAVTSQVNFQKAPPAFLFWDGRAASLEQQAIEPVVNPTEMGHSKAALVERLARIAQYRRYFAEAFGDRRVTVARVSRALADYERTRLSGNAPFDRWLVGQDESAVSASAKRGYALFTGKAQCAHCHTPPLFASGFHNTGIGWDAATQTFADDGRHRVTKGTIDETWPGTFRSPSLREVARRAPYMHDGSIATLRDVVEYYNRGANPNPYVSAFIEPLGLTAAEIDDIVAFLDSLNGEGWQDRGPTRFPE